MDLNDYWQENKRFVTAVAVGLLAFFIGRSVIDSVYADDIQQKRRTISKLRRDLENPLYSRQDQDRAADDNELLRSTVTRLADAVRFQPRPRFVLDPAAGTAPNQYLRALTAVREELLPLAGRANLAVDPGLGMPKLSPTRTPDVERYLEALDLVDVVVRRCIDAGVRRVDKIQVRLDPGLNKREGVGTVERTRVSFTLVGSSVPLTRVLAATQRPDDGRVLHVHEVEMVQSRNKQDEVRLELTLAALRVADVLAEEELEG